MKLEGDMNQNCDFYFENHGFDFKNNDFDFKTVNYGLKILCNIVI